MKTYTVYRKYVMSEMCKVIAKNKKEAIIKAREGDFKKELYDDGGIKDYYEWNYPNFMYSYSYVAEIERGVKE